MARLPHLVSFRGEVYSLGDPDSPEVATCISAFALRRSSEMYRILVRKENAAEGMRENSDSNRGACIQKLASTTTNISTFAVVDLLGKRLPHHTERHDAYRERDPLGLLIIEWLVYLSPSSSSNCNEAQTSFKTSNGGRDFHTSC